MSKMILAYELLEFFFYLNFLIKVYSYFLCEIDSQSKIIIRPRVQRDLKIFCINSWFENMVIYLFDIGTNLNNNQSIRTILNYK